MLKTILDQAKTILIVEKTPKNSLVHDMNSLEQGKNCLGQVKNSQHDKTILNHLSWLVGIRPYKQNGEGEIKK